MDNIFGRLKFVHHDEVFETRELAYDYVINKQVLERPSLVAEPMVLLYESGDAEKGPNVVLAIGSVGDGTQSTSNRTFFIDTQKTEDEIVELGDALEGAIKALTIVPIESDTIALHSEKTEDGTFLSGDVKIADYRISAGTVNENIIESDEKGIYAFVDMNYNPETFVISFTNGKVSKEFQLPKDQHVISGRYDIESESIILTLADESEVAFSVAKIIKEWTVLPDGKLYDGGNSPITLKITDVSANTTPHDGIYDWQSVLEADVRILTANSDNILEKTTDGKYLFVKGTADNIKYRNTTVADALDNVETKISSSIGNLIYQREDGIFASASLEYDKVKNTLIFHTSNNDDQEIQLNGFKLLNDVSYDSTTEEIIIRYIDSNGEYQTVKVPVSAIIREWTVSNDGHNVALDKNDSVPGADILTADVKIHEGDNNILEDKAHELYVNGVADNIKFESTGDTTVKNVLDDLSEKVSDNADAIKAEKERAEGEEERIEDKFDNIIGDGFGTAQTETVSWKFDKLSEKISDNADAIKAEKERAEGAEGTLDTKIDKEISDRENADTDLQNAIDDEETRAKAAEKTLDEKIDAEIQRSSEKDESIEKVIGSGVFSEDAHETISYLFKDLSDKVSDNTDAIDAEETRAKDAEQALTDKVNENAEDIAAEEIRAKEAEKTLDEKIDAEISDREKDIKEIKDIIGPDFTSTDARDTISQKIKELDEAIKSEETRAKGVEDDLRSDLDDEIARAKKAEGELADDIADETERAEKAEKELDEKIDGIANDRLIKVDDTSSVKLTKSDGENEIGNTITADVKISSESDNNIRINTDGIYSKVDLAYNKATNTLTFTTNEKSTEIALESNSLVDKVYYDATNEEIVIEYTVNGTRMDDVKVPVRSLINEWNVNSTSSVKLSKELNEGNGPDILTADVIINDVHDDNILVNDGGLYVSGAQIEANKNAIKDEADRATAAENALDKAIGDEENRAKEAEHELELAITAEETRATAAEKTLDEKIDAEKTRATTAESNLSDEITSINNTIGGGFGENETATIAWKFNDLSNKVSTGLTSLNQKDDELENSIESLSGTVISEVDELKRTDTSLGERIDTVSSDLSTLSSKVNTIDNTLNSANSTIEGIENDIAEINDKIGDGFGTAQTETVTWKFNELSGAVDSEIARSTQKDTDLANAITAEENRAKGVEDELRKDLDDEIAAREDATINVDNTTTVSLHKSDDEVGHTITADVNLSNVDGNIIKAESDGIYSNVNLTYDATSNKLTFTVNGASTTIPLVSNSLVDEVRYDASKEAIVIRYTVNNEHKPDIVVPVRDLINEWNVSSTDTIELTKRINNSTSTEGVTYDVLSANVKISNTDGNMLTTGIGGLYVSDSAVTANTAAITTNTNDIAELKENVSEISGNVNTISGELTTLKETVTSSNGNLENISNDLEALSGKVDSEIERSTQKDSDFAKILGTGFTSTDERDSVTQKFIDIERLINGNADSKISTVAAADSSVKVVVSENGENKAATIKVQLSELSDNIIKLNAYDGIYADVNLTYDDATNTLTFSKTGSEDISIPLNSYSAVSEIKYNKASEAIDITYSKNGTNVTTSIPLGDLIEEWTVSDSVAGAIRLTKERNVANDADVLSAEVVIDPHHDDNILVNHADGGLYVSGAQIEANKKAIADEVLRSTLADQAFTAKDTALQAAIEAEENRAKAKESEIATSVVQEKLDRESAIREVKSGLETEVNRAKNSEREILFSLTDEINRATARENEIDTKIINEINRASQKDTELTEAITNEIARSTQKDTELETAITAEATRAASAETALQTAIDNEVTRATNAESTLNDKIVAESSRATGIENGLRSDLNGEIARSTQKDTDLTDAINAEVTRATSAESDLTAAITAEENRASSAETALQNALNSEISRSVEKDNEISGKVTTLETQLTAEINRSTQKDGELETAITAEETRAKGAETALQTAIDTEEARATAKENALETAIENEIENRKSADSTLKDLIDAETTRATTVEATLNTAIATERDRAISREDELNTAITNEITRANNSFSDLIDRIAAEKTERVQTDSTISASVTTEIARAMQEENAINTKLDSEIARSTQKDTDLENAITAETKARQDAIDDVKTQIQNATLTFDDTTSIDFTKDDSNKVTAKVKVANSDDNIIIVDGDKDGVYASVKLSYNAGTNKLKLITSKGEQEEIQLNAGSVIDKMVYDAPSRSLVMTYTGADGIVKNVTFPVNELFNDWVVDNNTEQSALELTKTVGADGNADTIKGRVLLTNLEDNMIKIVNNGLYVEGKGIDDAVNTANCAKNELKAVERAVLGRVVSDDDCGENYTYESYENAEYINTATSVNHATYILDQTVKNLSSYTETIAEANDEISDEVNCIKTELNVTQENVLGVSVPDCGLRGDGTLYQYVPNEASNYISSATSFFNADIILDREIKKTNDVIINLNNKIDATSGDINNIIEEINNIEEGAGLGADGTYTTPNGCIISAATSLYNADELLDNALCQLREAYNNMMVGSDTVSTHMFFEHIGLNNYLKSDVRLSHGNTNQMTDEELYITNFTGATIEEGKTEFTDTNVLRIVGITSDDNGNELQPYAGANGLYLSSVWNCGEYTANGEGTPGNKYSTDDSASSSNYDYNNNVR